MMLFRILHNDLRRNRLVMGVAFSLVFLSAVLMAGGTRVIVDLSRAIDGLFASARTPDFVQMHAGELDVGPVEEWASAHPLVEEFQIAEMLTIDGRHLWISNAATSEANSVMDISFVRQNSSFDFLLDLDNRPVAIAEGAIGVPVYYLNRYDLQPGDTVTVRRDGIDKTFTITAFVRDSQMNPSIVHSKRFVVHGADYRILSENAKEREYLIEFRLRDGAPAEEFATSYESSALPQNGPAIDQQLFRTLSALTDGIVAALVIALSLLLMVVAILSLRFIILASMEEDYREIGVMKAIGMAHKDVRRIYLVKYLALGAAASLSGFAASIPLSRLLTRSLTLSMGQPTLTIAHRLVPVAAAGIVFFAVVASCIVVLRRFRKVTAVQALRASRDTDAPTRNSRLALHRNGSMDINVFLGLRDLAQRTRLYGLLWLVYFFAVFAITVPVHFLSTMSSPDFVAYMGIGRSDMRVDLRQDPDSPTRFSSLVDHLAADPDVSRFAVHVTSQFVLRTDAGEEEKIAIETGDFETFPLDYLRGSAPTSNDQIALSFLHARDMDKDIGDSVTLLVDGVAKSLTVSGIYQDVTNGGRTAKAGIEANPETILGYAAGIDLVETADATAKLEEYARLFAPARVTELEAYMRQTLGETIGQLSIVTMVVIAVGLAVVVLVTALFTRLITRKDAKEIAVKKSLGFSLRHIRLQYLAAALSVLATGVVIGTIFSNTLGQQIVSVLWSFMGAAKIQFVVDPLRAYVLLPLLILAAVIATTFSSMGGVRRVGIAQTIAE